jgi:hypothetical protein
MTQDPMVSALQGPQDPMMNALFQQPSAGVTFSRPLDQILSPADLMAHGRERLKDPNIPAYNPNNVDRPIIPGEQGSPFQGILNPRGWGTMVQQPHLQHMAGEVVPFPVSPQVADQRRMRNEDFMADVQSRFGQPGVDQFRRMWPSAPVVPLRPENQ